MAIYTNLVEHLPAEMWEIVFEKLQFLNRKHLNIDRVLKSDLYSCYFTCMKFKAILKETRHIWLFAEVAPFLVRYITKDTLLSCRLVCKSWKNSVDNYLENVELYFNTFKVKYGKPEFPYIQIVHTFSTATQISRFISDMENHIGNPFVGRTLEIYCDSSQQPHDIFWGIFVMQLLTKFGQHVYHLAFDLSFERYVESRLKSLLKHTPNLTGLRLTGYIPQSFYNNSLNIEMFELRELKALRMESDNSASESMNSIFPSGFQWNFAASFMNQLKQLQISLDDYLDCQTCLYLPILEILDIRISTHSQLHFIIPGLKCLKILRIKIKGSPATSHRLGDFLQAITSIRQSLQSLVIETAYYASLVTIPELETLATFGNLRHLSLKGFEFYFALKILKYFPQYLESLELSSGMDELTGETMVSLDIPCLEYPKDRKIMWKSLPRLRIFKMHNVYQNCSYEFRRHCPDVVKLTATKENIHGRNDEITSFCFEIRECICECGNPCTYSISEQERVWCMKLLFVYILVILIVFYFLF